MDYCDLNFVRYFRDHLSAARHHKTFGRTVPNDCGLQDAGVLGQQLRTKVKQTYWTDHLGNKSEETPSSAPIATLKRHGLHPERHALSLASRNQA